MINIKITNTNSTDIKILNDMMNSELRKKILGSFFKEKKIKKKLKMLFTIIADNQRLGFIYKNKKNIYICLRLKTKLAYDEIIKKTKNYFKDKKLNFHLIDYQKIN
jgi:hypothetical protein